MRYPWLLLLLACDDGVRPRVEVEDGTLDGPSADAGADVGREPLDPDARAGADAAADAAGDAAAVVDASADAQRPDRDAFPPDGAPVDAADDPPDLALDATADAGTPDAEVPVLVEVFGEARAADQRLEVTVRVGGEVTTTEGGVWRLALPPGPATLVFSAPDHEVIEHAIDVRGPRAEAPPVLLYRGTRIGEGAGGLLQFRFDGGELLWSEGDALRVTATDAPDPRTVVAAGLELFLGYTPAEDAVAIRLRGEPGIAGDIEVVALADGARRLLFREAQPWVRWRPDGTALGLVETREALSRLVVGRPGEASRVLAEGVPWLLVTELADGTLVWTQRAGEAFEVRALVDGESTPLAPEFPSNDAFLATTPGRTGLLWVTPDAGLVRWEPGGARRLADDVVASPRPRFAGQRLIYFMADDAGPGLRRIVVLDADGPRLLLDGAEGDSLALVGERWYATRPDSGLWTGTLAGERASPLILGDVVRFFTDGLGVLALADGAAWSAIPGEAALALQVEGLTQLTPAPTGGTAWQAATRTLWYLPGPGRAAPPMPIVADAPRPERHGESGGRALYVLGSQGFFRAPIPPGPPQTPFAVEVTALAPIDEARLLGWSDGGPLHQIDPRTGEAFGWAAAVTRVVTDFDGRFAAYVSDRGTYLATLAPAP